MLNLQKEKIRPEGSAEPDLRGERVSQLQPGPPELLTAAGSQRFAENIKGKDRPLQKKSEVSG